MNPSLKCGRERRKSSFGSLEGLRCSCDERTVYIAVEIFFCGMLAVGRLLKVTCQLIAGDDMVLECVEYLDRLRLGVSPGDTSEVFGQ